MAHFKRTSLLKKFFYSRTVALVVVLLVIFMGYSLFSVIEKSVDAKEARELSERKASQMMEREAELAKRLDALRSQEGKEAALREQFPVVKEGEHVILIVDAPEEESPVIQEKKGGFFGFIKNLFR